MEGTEKERVSAGLTGNTEMSDYWDFVPAGAGNPLSVYLHGMDFIRAISHGGARAIMDNLPVSGNVRRFKNEVKKAEDRYRNTGIDEAYSSPYNANVPFVSDLGPAGMPARMAVSLMAMYRPDVVHDATVHRYRKSGTIKMWPKDRLIGPMPNDIDMEEY